MRWRLSDGLRQVWLVDAFWDRESSGGRVLAPSEGVILLRALAPDPVNAGILQSIHAARRGAGSEDTFGTWQDPLTLTLADVFAGKLLVLVAEQPVAIAQEVVAEPLAEEEEEEAQPLVAASDPEPVVTPEVFAQVDALLRASEIGAPFCEE